MTTFIMNSYSYDGIRGCKISPIFIMDLLKRGKITRGQGYYMFRWRTELKETGDKYLRYSRLINPLPVRLYVLLRGLKGIDWHEEYLLMALEAEYEVFAFQTARGRQGSLRCISESVNSLQIEAAKLAEKNGDDHTAKWLREYSYEQAVVVRSRWRKLHVDDRINRLNSVRDASKRHVGSSPEPLTVRG